jgi:hypothetical protein
VTAAQGGQGDSDQSTAEASQLPQASRRPSGLKATLDRGHSHLLAHLRRLSCYK